MESVQWHGSAFACELSAGTVLSADLDHLPFYLAGGIAAFAWGQTISIALHLALAGCGMIMLTRRLGLNKLSQTISGLSFALCGFLVARASFFYDHLGCQLDALDHLWGFIHRESAFREKRHFPCSQSQPVAPFGFLHHHAAAFGSRPDDMVYPRFCHPLGNG